VLLLSGLNPICSDTDLTMSVQLSLGGAEPQEGQGESVGSKCVRKGGKWARKDKIQKQNIKMLSITI